MSPPVVFAVFLTQNLPLRDWGLPVFGQRPPIGLLMPRQLEEVTQSLTLTLQQPDIAWPFRPLPPLANDLSTTQQARDVNYIFPGEPDPETYCPTTRTRQQTAQFSFYKEYNEFNNSIKLETGWNKFPPEKKKLRHFCKHGPANRG